MGLINTIKGLSGKGLESALNKVGATQDDLLVETKGRLLDMTYPILKLLLDYDIDRVDRISEEINIFMKSMGPSLNAFKDYVSNLGDRNTFTKSLAEFSREREEARGNLIELFGFDNNEEFDKLRFAYYPLELMFLSGYNDSKASLYSGLRGDLIYCEGIGRPIIGERFSKDRFVEMIKDEGRKDIDVFPRSLISPNSDVAFYKFK